VKSICRSLNFWKMGASAFALVSGLTLAGCSASTDQVAAGDALPKGKSAAVAPIAGTQARMRLVTSDQYANTLHYIFGDDIKVPTAFAPLPRTDGLLESGAAEAGVTAGQLQQLARAATAVASQVVDSGNLEQHLSGHRDYLIRCKPASEKAADDACARAFIKTTGRLLFRRPLSDAKLVEFVAKAHDAADRLKDFYAGVQVVLEGMLVDPKVLMIADTIETDPKRPGHLRLDAYALASRLSFFLWNAAPDDDVLKAAETGEIMTPKGRARVVDMMLASPRVEQGARAFFDDMFAFDDFDNLAKDPTIYPKVTGATILDAREQTLRTVYDQLFVKNKDYRDLYTTRETFISPDLATVYNLPASAGGWMPYTFPPDSPRVGLLTQVSFLVVHSHPGRSSPTRRGKALRELLLCQRVPSPPPNVDFSLVDNPPPNIKTQRERVSLHLKNPVCAGCHRITDPTGLALENFDGGGQYRTTEKGAPIDPSGSLDGKPFADVTGLAQALHDHPALPQCLVKRLYAYGTGGPLSEGDDATLKYVGERFAAEGYRVPALLRTIAMSDAFANVVEAPLPSPAAKTTVASSSPAAR
jgi:hypothetical protein